MTREEAIKRLEKVEIQDGWSDEDKEYYSLIIEVLYQPEIIYCKDCKNFMEYSDEYKQIEKADGDCFNQKINTVIKKKFCDYCSFAERR